MLETTLTPAIEQGICEYLQAYLKQELVGHSIHERYPYQFEVEVTAKGEEWFAFFYCYQGQLRCHSMRKSEAG